MRKFTNDQRQSLGLLGAICVVVGGMLLSFSAKAQVEQQLKWPEGCLVSQGDGGFSARYLDPKTYEPLETIRIPATGEPSVVRSRNAQGKGIVRKHCEAMVREVLGGSRAKQLLRLSD